MKAPPPMPHEYGSTTPRTPPAGGRPAAAEHAGGGAGRVDGVAAVAERVDGRLRGERVDRRGGAAGADRGRLLGGGAAVAGRGGRGGGEQPGDEQEGDEDPAHEPLIPGSAHAIPTRRS